VAGDIGGRDLEELRKGAEVLVWGQLSERLSIEDGRTSRHPVIVAAHIHAGPQPGGEPIAPSPPSEAA
jgi:hypothetical protein